MGVADGVGALRHGEQLSRVRSSDAAQQVARERRWGVREPSRISWRASAPSPSAVRGFEPKPTVVDFPTAHHGRCQPRGRWLLVGPRRGAEFPGCQLDNPTWGYLTSRRRVSCICRFPLGFLSHVSMREVPPGAERFQCFARGVLSSSISFFATWSRMRRARGSSRCFDRTPELASFGVVSRGHGEMGREAMVMAMGRTVAPKVRTDVA